MLIFSGSRNLSKRNQAIVNEILAKTGARFGMVGVGCAKGLDSFVRNSPEFSGVIFKSQSQAAFDLIQRSAALVHAAALYPKASKNSALFIFADCKCPSGLFPSPSINRCFRGLGSGTWATAALAAGLGLPVFAFGAKPSDLPKGWGGWVVNDEHGALCFRCEPPQQRLF